ncbi:uncharacterized protein J3D65DRAFT_606101 [Phyllosticta citribraziliensis]|uniref:Uncharacterized protein n=1 Tax=Phyllosticta citribraziliensis TaxID=989973 RepID=A0ABR1LA81_9PEZI
MLQPESQLTASAKEDFMDKDTQYDTQRAKDKAFEDLVCSLLAQTFPLSGLHQTERQYIIDQVKLLARDSRPLSVSMCRKIASDVSSSLQKASKASSGRYDFAKMVMVDISLAVKSLTE